MRRRRLNRRKRRGGLPYVYKNKVYFGKISQKGSGILTNLLAKILMGAGNTAGISMIKNRYRIKRRRKYKKKKGRGIFGDGFQSFYSIGKAWRKSMQ